MKLLSLKNLFVILALCGLTILILADCKKEKKPPEKPYSGKITLRIPPEVHRRVAIKAAEHKESMNEYLEKLLEKDTSDVASACE